MAHFFNKTPAQRVHKRPSDRNFISVGGEPFHAVAVAFLDCFKRSTRVNEETLKKVLERFFTLYPQYISVHRCATASDRMKMLLSLRKSEIVDRLAHTFRQLAVDEIYANPTQYREVFLGLDAKVSQEHLRQAGTPLPPIALNAINQSLDIDVSLYHVEQGKELGWRESFNKDAVNSHNFEMEIQVQDGHYFPRVRFPEDFTYVGQLPPQAVTVNENTKNPATLVDMFEQISCDNTRLYNAFEQNRKRLMSMVAAGELTKEHLLQLYIEFLPRYSSSIISNTKFFYQLDGSNRKPIVSKKSMQLGLEEAQLVDALAGKISTKQIDADQLFERIEGKSLSSKKMHEA